MVGARPMSSASGIRGLYGAIGRSMVSRYAVYGANLVSLVVLARLFSPATFGAVAAIQVFYVFFQFVAEAGLGPAIINLHELSERDRDGIFSLTLLVGAACGALFACLRPGLDAFYGSSRVGEVVPYVALTLPMFAAAVLPNALMQRQRAFYGIGVAGVLAEAVSTASSALLIRYLDPVHALACKLPIGGGVNFLILHRLSAATEFGRPRLGKRLGAIKPLLRFSAYQFAFNFVNFFTRNLDNVLVGKYIGQTALGVYDKSYRLMSYPLMLLTGAMVPAIQPVIRQHADNVDHVEEEHRRFLLRLSLVGACAGALLFLFAREGVLIVLGSQWLQVVPLVRILAITVPVQIVLSTSGSFFLALGRSDLLFLCGLASGTCTGTAIVWGVGQGNLQSLAWALVFAFHVNFFVAYVVMYKWLFKRSPLGFFMRMLPALTTALAIGLAARLVLS